MAARAAAAMNSVRFMSVSTPLWARSSGVLRGNDSGRYTRPSRSTYPHQWNWDSALAALGWAELDAGRAWTELETLAGARDAGGMFPHIAFQPRLRVFTVRYVPGRAGGGGARASTAAASRHHAAARGGDLPAAAVRAAPRRAPRARHLIGPLHAWHRFLLGERDPLGTASRCSSIRGSRAATTRSSGITAVARDAGGDGGAPARHRLGRRRRAAERRARPALPHARPAGHCCWNSAAARGGAFPRSWLQRDPGAPATTSPRLAETLGEAGSRTRAAGRRAGGGGAARAPRSTASIRPLDMTDGSTLVGHERRLGAGAARAGPPRQAGGGGSGGGAARPACFALGRALARSRAPRVLGAQLLARAGLGQHHLAHGTRARAARRASAPRRHCASG